MESLVSVLFVALLCLVLPASGVRQWLFGVPPLLSETPKPRIQASAIFNCAMLGFVGWLTMRLVGINLLRPWHPTLIEAVAGPILFGATFAANRLLWPWMQADPRRSNIKILPSGVDEYPMWTAVSVAAGVGEELAYRGALFLTLTWWSGQQWVALGLVAVSFAAAHLRQGMRAALFILVFGALLQLLVMVSGSLYMAMIVHAAYDIAIGVVASRRASVNQPGEPDAQSAIFHP